MDGTVRVCRVNHTLPSIAAEIHSVQTRAYTQEAALLGAVNFPPLRRTVDDVRTSLEEFLVAYHGDLTVGVIGFQSEPACQAINISSLVVAPPYQRQGIARRLVAEVLRMYSDLGLTVQTGARNHPALALYAQLGFTHFRQWRAASDDVELVELRRAPFVEGNAS